MILGIVWFGEPVVPLFLPVVAALVGTFGGLVVGQRVANRAANSAWQREQRRAEYVSLAEAAARLQLDGLGALLDQLRDHASTTASMSDAVSAFSVQLARARLFASRPVEAAGDALLDWTIVIGALVQYPNDVPAAIDRPWIPKGGLPAGAVAKYDVFRRASARLIEDLTEAIRADLGLSTTETVVRPNGRRRMRPNPSDEG